MERLGEKRIKLDNTVCSHYPYERPYCYQIPCPNKGVFISPNGLEFITATSSSWKYPHKLLLTLLPLFHYHEIKCFCFYMICIHMFSSFLIRYLQFLNDMENMQGNRMQDVMISPLSFLALLLI